MEWNDLNVNRTGPIEDGGAYVMLDGAWFYVPSDIAQSANETALAAIIHNKRVQVGHENGEIRRIHLIG